MQVEYTTAAVDPEVRRAAGMRFFDDRVVVTEVEADSPAWKAGVRPGSFITHVDRQPVRTPREFASAVANRDGDVRLRVAVSGQKEQALIVVPKS